MPGNLNFNLFKHGILAGEGQVFQIAAIPSDYKLKKTFEWCKKSADARDLGEDDWYQIGKDFSNSNWNAYASAVVFEFDDPIPFLDSGEIENRMAYLVVFFLENTSDLNRKYMFVQRRNVGDPRQFFRGQGIAVEEIEHTVLYEPFSKVATRYEYLAVKPLSIEKSALKKKTLTSRDVRSNISSLGLSRSIPSAVKLVMPGLVGQPDRRISINSTTKRFREQGVKGDFLKLSAWVIAFVHDIDNARNVKKISSAFLGAFAQPVANLNGLTANSVLIDIFGIRDVFRESSDSKIFDHHNTELSQKAFDELLNILGEVVFVAPTGTRYAGRFSLNGAVCSVSLKILLKTCNLVITNLPFTVKTPSGTERLDQFIERRKFYRVTFEQGTTLFSPEGTFRDGDIAESAKLVLGMVRQTPLLAAVTTEKGNPSTNTNFDIDSSFYAIRQHIASSSKWLICDDSTNEWCDFIGYEDTATGPKVTWFHAKVKRNKNSAGTLLPMGAALRGSSSASGLQEVVGQAIKNLGRLRLRAKSDGVPGRSSTWLQAYEWPDDKSAPKVQAGFARLCKHPGVAPPTAADVTSMLKDFDLAATNSNTVYEVALVVPNYRFSTLQNVFRRLGTTASSATAPQLFWLLSGYMSSCLEVGARPAIYCL